MSNPTFDRINGAMLRCGVSAFALLYRVRPLLPHVARWFGVMPAQRTWPLSVSTAKMALWDWSGARR